MSFISDIKEAKTAILNRLDREGGKSRIYELANPKVMITAATRDIALDELQDEGLVLVEEYLNKGRKGRIVRLTAEPNLEKIAEKVGATNGYRKVGKALRRDKFVAPKNNQPICTKPPTVQIENQYFAPDEEQAQTIPLAIGLHIIHVTLEHVRIVPLKAVAEPARNQLLEEENKRLTGLVEALEAKNKKIASLWSQLDGTITNTSRLD